MHGLIHIRLESIQNTDKMSSRLASRRGPPHTTSRQCSRYQGRKQSPRPHFLHSHSSSSWHYTPSLPSVTASRPITNDSHKVDVLEGYFRLATSYCQPLRSVLSWWTAQRDFPKHSDWPWGTYSFLFRGCQGIFFLEGQHLKHDVVHLLHFSVLFKPDWSYNSSPAICHHGVDKDNFTFTFYCPNRFSAFSFRLVSSLHKFSEAGWQMQATSSADVTLVPVYAVTYYECWEFLYFWTWVTSARNRCY